MASKKERLSPEEAAKKKKRQKLIDEAKKSFSGFSLPKVGVPDVFSMIQEAIADGDKAQELLQEEEKIRARGKEKGRKWRNQYVAGSTGVERIPETDGENLVPADFFIRQREATTGIL